MAINDIMGLLGRAGEVIGGGTPGLYGGLLSEEELRQAKNKASTKALFDLSASLAEAARPQSGRPIGTFGAIAKGLSAAQQGYQGTLQQQAKEKLAMQEMQRQMQAKQRADQAQALGGRLFTQATPAQPAPYLAGAPYGKATPAQPGGINQEVFAQLQASPEGRAVLAEIQKTTTPEYKVVGDRLFKMPTLGMGTPEDVGGADKSTNAYKDFMRAKDEGFKGSFMDYQLGLKKAGASSQTVTLGGDKALADTVGKDIGSMIGAATEQARVARETLTNAGNIEAALSKAITGPAADTRTVLLRVGQSLGVAGKDANEILANTQILVQGLAKAELQAAEAMKGQGQITENERLIIKRASAGTQDMTPAEIRASLIAIRKVAENKIKRHSTLFEQFKNLPNVEKYAPFYELPAYTPQYGGETQKSLQQMLDDEAAKRGL